MFTSFSSFSSMQNTYIAPPPTPSPVISYTSQTGAISDTTTNGIREIAWITTASAGTGVVNVGTFTAGKTYTSVTILVVSGGGGGGSGVNGWTGGGGGGGGAVVTGTTYTINSGTICSMNISTGGLGTSTTLYPANNNNSSIQITSGSILLSATSVGTQIIASNSGNSGSTQFINSTSPITESVKLTGGGGSGGGGGGGCSLPPLFGGTGIFPGGNGVSNYTHFYTIGCGGGGGNNGEGVTATMNEDSNHGIGGDGGPGTRFYTNRTNSNTSYGSGGGGSSGSNNASLGGKAGVGGSNSTNTSEKSGGDGGMRDAGGNAVQNTGSGGGGGCVGVGGNGSNGIIIIRFTV